MKSNIFIPKKVNVGYQKRSGTYTGKLAYIIYYDEKGKLRKEASWSSWRDDKIPNNEFENIPTSGFVLNKKVGDYDSGWNHRQAYCRIYDPRNFEFEITIENLLYILENTNSIKGKGLEGDFVYGWDGKDLILIPTESPDYKEMETYNSLIHSNEKIKASDLIIGATYLTKSNEERIYMGKFDYYSSGYQWTSNGEIKTSKKWSDVPENYDRGYMKRSDYKNVSLLYGKYFWFAYKYFDYTYVNGECVYSKTKFRWVFEKVKSISGKFIQCTNSKCNEEYANVYEKMLCCSDFSPIDKTKEKLIRYTFDEFKRLVETRKFYYEGTEDERPYMPYESYFNYPNSDNEYFRYDISANKETGLYEVKPYNVYSSEAETINKDYYERFNFNDVEVEYAYGWRRKGIEKQFIPCTIEEIYERLQPCYKEEYLENGKLHGRSLYYGDEQ